LLIFKLVKFYQVLVRLSLQKLNMFQHYIFFHHRLRIVLTFSKFVNLLRTMSIFNFLPNNSFSAMSMLTWASMLLVAAAQPSYLSPISITWWEDQQCYLGDLGTWTLGSYNLDATLGYYQREAGSFAITDCRGPCVIFNSNSDPDSFTTPNNLCASSWLCNCAVSGNGANVITIGATTNMDNPFEWCGTTGQTYQEPSAWYCEVQANTWNLEPEGKTIAGNQYFDVDMSDNSNWALGGLCPSGDGYYVCRGGYVTWTGNVMDCDSQGNIVSGSC
jgi:hypothetical protein